MQNKRTDECSCPPHVGRSGLGSGFGPREPRASRPAIELRAGAGAQVCVRHLPAARVVGPACHSRRRPPRTPSARPHSWWSKCTPKPRGTVCVTCSRRRRQAAAGGRPANTQRCRSGQPRARQCMRPCESEANWDRRRLRKGASQPFWLPALAAAGPKVATGHRTV